MKEFKETKTYENLMTAFAGESQARNKYTYYASKAKKEGYIQIAKVFEETAANEKEHAEIWFKLFHGVGGTAENLLDAAAGEHEEWTSMYLNMAKEARDEGFMDIAEAFEKVGSIEKRHEERYRKLKQNIDEGRVFERDEEVEWICSNCGFTYKGKSAVDSCPVCSHSKAYFQLNVIDY